MHMPKIMSGDTNKPSHETFESRAKFNHNRRKIHDIILGHLSHFKETFTYAIQVDVHFRITNQFIESLKV